MSGVAFYYTNDVKEFLRWLPDIDKRLFEHMSVQKLVLRVGKLGAPAIVFTYDPTWRQK